MKNPWSESLSVDEKFLLPHRYRKIGKLVSVLGIPVVLLLNTLAVVVFDVNPTYWDEWGLYLMHVPLSLGLYWILFSEEKDEDEFYLSLRLRSIARGVISTVVAMALLPFYSNVLSIIMEQTVTLPDVGGNMAVCTLLLVYANGMYFYNKSLTEKDD